MSKPFSMMLMVGSLLVSCSQANYSSLSATQAKQTVSLTISAAASLTDAIAEVEQLYEQQYPQVSITSNFASSGSLQRQIEQGAPVDVFISAASNKMDVLQKQELLLDDSRQDLLQNKIVLIVSKKNSTISEFKDLASTDVYNISIGEPDSVPAGKYAQQVLTSLGIFEQVKPKTVFAKNVRQVLAYVETGNVDAGIVYATDAKDSDKVKIVAVAPTNSHSPIVYPTAALKQSKNPAVAKDFVAFLLSDSADDVFEKHGFTPVSGSLLANQ
ncbi:MAG: molybdate ABC transporter substrate-binding protein [Symploca sp. SIO3C6]|uniref:Molybdate ABC transporter substrate-binding protein n=1 Tax=Symploca sp. SIO1C4 TaxID=2607765 RepID=A0A6B3NDD0_9CYAN|nr:molybdate ABC transporter substrate-binding protein [Symploca sp. SIO3C6]NER27148.1 molybdate ABC transporter substrate-binding protein [Symploca sp. SIO1C4]